MRFGRTLVSFIGLTVTLLCVEFWLIRGLAAQKSQIVFTHLGFDDYSAFATAAFVSTAALAATLLVAPDAEAGWCGNLVCGNNFDCCAKFENQAFEYACVPAGFCCPWEDPPGCWEP